MIIDASYYCIVDYTEEAKELNVSGEANMVIIHMVNGMPMKEESFSHETVKRLEDMGVSVIPLAHSTERPSSAIRSVIALR